MHRRSVLLALPALPVSAAAVATPDAAIRAVLAAQQDAWNRGDLNAFMTAYWNSPELTFVGGEIARGFEATLARYRKRYPDRAAMGTLTFSDIEVHTAGNEAAWVYGRFALARTAAGGGPATGKYTLVLRLFAGAWKIVLDHTSS